MGEIISKILLKPAAADVGTVQKMPGYPATSVMKMNRVRFATGGAWI